jgi:hypothetical protein
MMILKEKSKSFIASAKSLLIAKLVTISKKALLQSCMECETTLTLHALLQNLANHDNVF